MSILIKGLEMPSCCYDCNFCRHYDEPNQGYYCAALCADLHRENITETRSKGCPLVPVPPHGRLIDESWLKETLIETLEAIRKNPKMDMQEMHLIASFATLGEMVADAPTIIEAEEHG